MQITSGVVTTDGVVFNTTYYDPMIFLGGTATFTLTANTGFYDLYNSNTATFTLTSNTGFYDLYNSSTATFTLTKGSQQ